ncbi:AAA family ATPase [Sorangium sp. So ce341]|uniref:AAA family ATPase n=1 Tax=Sorangium sp. So ce341 TaxID=3133302 RepID=UPI003F624AE3
MIQLAQYTLTEKVHDGLIAAIYRGYRNTDGLRIGVKLLKSEYPGAREIARLRHEFSLVKELALDGVVAALGLERHGHSVALVMEDFGGRSLSELIQERRLTLDAALQVASSVAHTLDAVHRRRVFHKDIKPQNILVDMAAGAVKLIDFGIAARLSQETPKLLSPGALEGTLAYMSPEQTGRMNRVVDHRSDLYSLGVTLYEMLTGVLPFRAADPVEIVHSHIARIPPSPRELSPDVPEVVSDIVMRLLAKAAEDRYQSARGLAVDLDECRRRLDATGSIARFPLGRHDFAEDLLMPQKLYGRDEEIAALVAAWERVSRGGAELLLVSGRSGVGKSALVHEIHKAIARGQGRFIAGKFDQLSRSSPYSAIAGAFRELFRGLLTESEEELARWKTKLKAALGSNGQLLTNLIPELGLVLGPQPDVPDLGPTEAQNRFSIVFQNFLHAIAPAERPLVLFLDDLQWADSASLTLLRVLLTDPARGHLLVIGAYRDNEVDPQHPLVAAVDGIRAAGALVREICVKPLSQRDVEQLLGDLLGCERDRAAPLAAVVSKRTGGNPFFLTQFLLSIHRDKLVWREPGSGRWCWDLERIDRSVATDNVVDLVALKLRRLAPTTQHVLGLAACIGYQFELQTLATLRGTSPSQVAGELWEALEEGVVVPLDPEYRLVGGLRAASDGGPAATVDFDVSYRFVHDRVQQAAYALTDEGERRAVHLRVGRRMLSASGGAPSDERLFTVVDHMNLGAALITDAGERLDLAARNLAAGRKAKASTAYQAAVSYLRAGAAMLDATSREDEPELSFAIQAELAECEYMSGAHDRAEALFDDLVSGARSNLARAKIQAKRIVLLNTRGRFAEAVSVGRATLSLFGVHLPDDEEERRAALEAQLAVVQAAIAARGIEDVIHLPELTDPDKRIVIELLTHLDAPVFQARPDLYPLLTATSIGISLTHGHSELSAYGYVAHGFALAAFHGRYAEAREFGKLALALNEKHGNAYLDCKLNFLFAAFLHFCGPLRAVADHASIAVRAGLEVGDFNALSYACTVLIAARMGMGANLSQLREEIDGLLALMQRTRDALTTPFLVIARQVTANLAGQTKGRGTLGDEAFDEREFAATMEASGLSFGVCWYKAQKAGLLFLYGDHEGALSMAEQAQRASAPCTGLYFTTELAFFTCLALAALASAAPGEEREALAARLGRHHAEIGRWAESCPENYRHMHELVSAEIARISGKHDEAAALYDDAIASARRGAFLHHAALASELCATFYRGKGRLWIARSYMTEAYQGYLRWGAVAKAAELVERSRELVGLGGASATARLDAGALPLTTVTTTTSSVTTGSLGAGLLDAAALIRAAQAISREIELDAVLERVMQIVAVNAGAQRGFFLRRGADERLLIDASFNVAPDEVKVGLAIPVEASSALAATIVQYVARTNEAVVLGDATADERFAADPYVVACRPRSVLCLATTHQGRLTGVLYLENNVATGAFTPSRTELIGLLCSQAAIAVENALLYARVNNASEALRRANETLESEVAHRTEELRSAYRQLELELDERSRAERERAALQEEIIAVQDERLKELSTPLIPISDRVVVMPLIGTMDARRAEQVLATALHGVQASGADVVILDITGIKQVDAGVACTLVRTASALRLLGAKAVLTGVRAEVAQALVGLDVDLRGIVTLGTLQSGIAYALKHGAALTGQRSSMW